MRTYGFALATALGGIIILGGVVLYFGPALVEQYQRAAAQHPYWGYGYLATLALVALAFLSLSVGTLVILARNSWAKTARRERLAKNPSQMSRSEQELEILNQLAEAKQLADDPTLPPEVRAPVRDAASAIEAKQAAQSLEIVVFGTVSSGKSSLLNALAGRDCFRTDPRGGTTLTRSEIPWPGRDRVTLVDTPGLAEIGGDERETLARRVARDADLVLFVVDGPLKDFEHRLLTQLAEMEKRVLVCLNKQDWFPPADRARLLGQIAEQLPAGINRESLLAISAQSTTRTRVRVLADGGEVEEPIALEAEIGPLATRMMTLIDRDGRDLLLANLLLRSRGVAADARRGVQTTLDQRARELVDRAAWQAGGAAALSPFPLLDVVAGLGVSSKLVLDLARVYRQPMDLETASRLVGELGKNLIAILGTSLAAPAVASGVASLVKTVPGIGTLAGGAVQGVVQALVTRWIGRVFIEYFRNEMQEPPLGWASLAREKWGEVTRPAELAQLVRHVLGKNGETK